MKVFNCMQLVAAFVACPFGIAWLTDQSFKGSTVALIASYIAYVIFCIFMVTVTHEGVTRMEKEW